MNKQKKLNLIQQLMKKTNLSFEECKGILYESHYDLKVAIEYTKTYIKN